MVRGVRNRYDGERRNPWNEVECGNHYARAMASWSLLLAFSGFRYSAPERTMAFQPARREARFVSFWSADPGWGVYEQSLERGECASTIKLLYGTGLTLERLVLPSPDGAAAEGELAVQVDVEGARLEASARLEDGKSAVTLASPATIRAGEAMAIRIRV